MAKQDLNIGTLPNDGTGDTLREAMIKIEANTSELYSKDATTTIICNQTNKDTTLGGVIDSSKVYVIDGIIDMGTTQITVPTTGMSLKGYSFDISGLTSSEDAYTMFVSESIVIGSGNMLGFDYFISVTGAGSKVYELYDATGFNAFEFLRVNYIDCTSLGDIYDYRQGLESGTGRFGGSPSLTLHGVWLGGYRATTSIVRSLAGTMTEPLFKEGTLFQMSSRFLTDMNVDLPTLAPFTDFSPINFPNPSTIQLQGMEVTRDGAYDSEDTNLTPNLDAGDLPCYWKNNSGLPNTYVGGTASITVEAVTTVAVVSDYYYIAGTWSDTDLQHFSLVANGGLKYLGNTPRDFEVSLNLNLDSTANNELSIKLFKYDDSLATEVALDYTIQTRPVNNLVSGRDVAFFVNFTDITLDKDDIVYCKVANNTATNDITAELLSFVRIQER